MFYDVYVALCEEKGVRPTQAAEDMGINKSSVTNWKKNGYSPRADILNKIADYFGVTVGYLTGASEDRAPIPTLGDERPIALDDFTYAMFEEGKELTEMDKQILLSMATQLNDARKKKDGEPG